jgi:hypothetical protein
MTLEAEIVDHLLRIYESNEKLSEENRSTQKSVAQTQRVVAEVKLSLDRFIADQLRRRREGHR